jgi:hypothetical protein
MRYIIAIFLLVSCGKKTIEPVRIEHSSLRYQVERIEPLLEWRCGLPTEPNRSDCSGDAISMAGRWFLDSGDVSRLPYVLASFGADNRPYRNSELPDYSGNSFSRDALMGILEVTAATKDFAALDKLEAYVAATGRLCPGDDRCDITPSMRLLMKEARGYKPTALERAQDELTIQGEAVSNPPTYRTYLVLRKLRIKLETGNVTPGYQAALDVVLKRFPKGIFQRIIDAKYNESERKLASAANALELCMAKWTSAGQDWVGNAIDKECADSPQGHELVAMAKWILR